MQVVQVTTPGSPTQGSAMLAPFFGRKVAIRNPTNRHYFVEDNNTLHAHQEDHGAKGHFVIVMLPNGLIQFQTHHGRFISIDAHGKVHSSTHATHDDSHFFVEWHNGRFAFRNGSHGRHLGITPHGHLEGRHSLSDDEMFELIPFDY